MTTTSYDPVRQLFVCEIGKLTDGIARMDEKIEERKTALANGMDTRARLQTYKDALEAHLASLVEG